MHVTFICNRSYYASLHVICKIKSFKIRKEVSIEVQHRRLKDTVKYITIVLVDRAE